jgi:hypothetical protein
MKMSRSLARITPGLLLAALAGCGGGGGGGDGVVPLAYSGNTNQAAVTTGNAAKLTANVMGDNDAAAIIGPLSVAPSGPVQTPSIGFADVARSLHRAFRDTLSHAQRASAAQPLKSAAIPINDTFACDGNIGSVRITGTLNDNGTGTVNVAYIGCNLNGLILDGPATMRIDVFDLGFLLPTDFTVSFPRITLRGAGISSDVGGSLRAQLNIGANTETTTLNVVSLDNNTGDMTKSENLVLVAVHVNILSPTSFTATITGRSFDGVHGFVDVTTPTQLAFGSTNQLFPDSGQLLLTGVPEGAGNRTILVTAQSSTMTQLELDTNGDGTPDNTALLKWTDLTGPIGADLADADADTMHNSWESAYCPGCASPTMDVAPLANNDGDIRNNLQEYQAGTDPNDPLSF